MTALQSLRAVALCLLVAVPGCDRAAAERPGAQLAAKVNGAGISLRELRTAGVGVGGASAAIAGAALEKVIERELLVQQALHAGLDHDARVLESVENARRQLLAQAWLEKVAAGRSVSRDEVREFYAANPALFAERRIYRLRELAVEAPAEMIEVLRAEAARAADLDEVAAWLHARNARFSATAATLAAEQVPLARLPRLARMQAGEITVFAEPGASATVAQLVRVEDAALSEQQAAPVIEQFLAARSRLEAAQAEVKRLRQVATIEYVGEFKRNN
jgi:EpsD family peptidyl-prolyl cis-trans isomerase